MNLTTWQIHFKNIYLIMENKVADAEDFFHLYTMDRILKEPDYTKKRTKIICTIGPACNSVETLIKMIDLGMNCARLNFSHGDHKSHGKCVENLKEAFRARRNIPVSILLDTKGPEIRTGFLENEGPVFLVQGEDLELVIDYEFKGNKNKIACSYPRLMESVKVGGAILVADGTLVLKVKEIREKSVVCEIMNKCKLGERKNMNLPGCEVHLPTITEKDEDDIVDFALKKGVDYIALSFVRKASDIEECRDLLGPKGSRIKIIAKIENQEGLHNYDEILKATDAIMIARGDLGMEIPPQKVFVAQKWMTKKANNAGKPVVVATQMLESMITNPRPTRAEASDVANAVLDGTDTVMLSGETAGGDHPLEAVGIMAKICVEAETTFSYRRNFKNLLDHRSISLKYSKQEAMAISAVQLSFDLESNAIICFTENGLIAGMLSKYRPKAWILAVSIEDKIIKGLSCNYGIVCLKIPSFQGLENIIRYAVKCSVDMGYAKVGDPLVLMYGQNEEHPDQEQIMKIVTACTELAK